MKDKNIKVPAVWLSRLFHIAECHGSSYSTEHIMGYIESAKMLLGDEAKRAIEEAKTT